MEWINKRYLAFGFYVLVIYFCFPALSLLSYFYALNEFLPLETALYSVADALAGVFLIYWFLSGIITGSRFKPLETLVGLPVVMRLHICSAIGVFLWVLTHFILKGLPLSMQAWVGFICAIIYTVLVLSAVIQWVDTPITKLLNRLPIIRRYYINSLQNTQYQRQRCKHNIIVIAAILAYVHVTLSSMAEIDRRFFMAISVYFGLSLGQYLNHKFLKPLLLRLRGGWELKEIREESSEVTSLIFAPPAECRKFKYRAGQFGFLRFINGGLKGEEHPFSFSSHPLESSLEFTIQHSGDFTSRLRNEAAVGDRAILDGPYGRFFPDSRQRSKPLLFIAGGIGIVPFISILKEYKIHPPTKKVSLFWLISPQKEFLIPHLQDYGQTPNLDLHLFSRSRDKPLNLETLERIPDLDNREVFLCASESLTGYLQKLLGQVGVRRGRVHTELFTM